MKDLATFIAATRFGLGARPDELDLIEPDPRNWIKNQIISRSDLPKAFSKFRSSKAIVADIQTARATGREALRDQTRLSYRQDFRPELAARFDAALNSPAPFAERMVLFWSNHFTVSNTKRIIGPALPAYEREVIRPHIFGRFSDMLKAAISHPVMLTYLDNALSMGENSRICQRRIARQGSQKTLNENLAREVLELHTLGVNGGYDQGDVIALAKGISGWSFGGARYRRDAVESRGNFLFRNNFHEPGSKVLLGKNYAEDGASEGFAMLDELARHPSTARLIATKLARHFISDAPPEHAIDVLAEAFLSSEGNLGYVSEVLVDLPEIWANPLPKVKSHYELVVSAHRALGIARPNRRQAVRALREFGQMPFTAPSPAGWGDRAQDWIAPETLMRRIEWSRGFAGQTATGLIPTEVLETSIGPVASQSTRTWVERAPSGDAAIALILASPEFQRR